MSKMRKRDAAAELVAVASHARDTRWASSTGGGVLRRSTGVRTSRLGADRRALGWHEAQVARLSGSVAVVGEHLEPAASGQGGTTSFAGGRGRPYGHAISDKVALRPLLDHDNVRRWVKNHIALINSRIESESTRDDEQGLGLY